MTIIEYCTEEVRRQGHDVTVLEGAERVGWMLEAWSLAACVNRLEGSTHVNISIIEELGRTVEPSKNDDGFRRCGVRVGATLMPRWAEVPGKLAWLLDQQGSMAPFDFYRAFLEIHPFVDGNGRVGKILLNWKNGTLLSEPIFPPNDFWGGCIINP